MRKLLLSLALALPLTALASSDTISVNNSLITNTVIDKSTNSKGKITNKYYVIYNNQLVSTNKTTIDYINLSKKYNTTYTLIMIINKSGRKRIVLQ